MSNCKYCDMPDHPGVNCDREFLKHRIQTLKREVEIKTMELQAHRKLEGDGVIMVTSLISHRSRKPRVDIQVGEIHTQLEADAACALASNIASCAAGAYADGFLFHFLTEELHQTDVNAGSILQSFRAYREKLAIEYQNFVKEKGETSGNEG